MAVGRNLEFLEIITYMHDNATQIVKGHCGFLWDDPTSIFPKSETLKPINTKFCTIDKNRLHVGSPNYTRY